MFDEVDLILNEEKRAYAANGRIRGGLGSLDVGLQSEPNYGWTEEGRVPVLLWDEAEAITVHSPNVAPIIRLHKELNHATRGDCEEYLLSHLQS